MVAASVEHLEQIVDQLSRHGPPTTSLVFSRAMESRLITPELLEWKDRGEDLPLQDGVSPK